MTQKELLYMEDAVNHENSIISILNDCKEKIDNKDIISFLENEINVHKKIYEKLINHLERISYE